jgi:probable nitrogen fixation protein
MNELADGSAAELIERSPFLSQLVKQLRALDTHGQWEGKRDEVILGPFVVDREARKRIPIIDDPDPEVFERMDLYYGAAALAIERASGVMVTMMIKMHHEGFGRVMLTAGRLILFNRYHRDVHRFGFDSLGVLAQKGDEVVAAGVDMVHRFPEIAAYDGSF